MAQEQSRLRVVLAGPDRRALADRVNPVLCRTGRFEVVTAVTTPDELRRATVAGYVHLVIVEAHIASDPDGAMALLSELAERARVVAVMPESWRGQRETLSALPDAVMLLTAPVNWDAAISGILEQLGLEDTRMDTPQDDAKAGRQRSSDVSAESGPSSPPAQIHLRGTGSTVRIGFFGERGGVGTSTAALTAAQMLAGEKRRVALFDAGKRGDLHLMAKIQPVERPVTRDAITFFLESPTEETVRDFDAVVFDAVVVDGGRARGNFNAEWHAVSRPLSGEKIAQLVGVRPPASEKEQVTEKGDPRRAEQARERKPKRAGGLNLGNLISIEVE